MSSFLIEKAANKATSGFASDYAALSKVEAVDKYTVRLTFKNPIPSVLGILANYHGGYIISKKAYEEKGDKFKFDPIGTGPFMLKEYVPKEKVVEARHPDFFRGKPRPRPRRVLVHARRKQPGDGFPKGRN